MKKMALIFLLIPAVVVGGSRFFPDTWACKKCGYDNYEGIDYCGMCGNYRYD